MVNTMLKTLKNSLSRYVTNSGGWSTRKNIVVFESDDWGSIRMPSKTVYQQCLKAGYPVDQIAYERYDSLAGETDLELLFELLAEHRDSRGKPAVFTANVLVANPDFEKIAESDFREYHYELVTDTFARYPQHANCFSLWKDGRKKGVFYPQSHGREHLNVAEFMQALQKNDPDARFGFAHRMPGSIPRGTAGRGNRYVEALRYTDPEDKTEKKQIVLEGLDLFHRLLGYRSLSFIAPNHIWSPDFDEAVAAKGVRFYQGRKKMKEPLFDGGYRINKYHLGQTNSFNQYYLVRNATFEPALQKESTDPVDRCLKDIQIAFRCNKPAVISTHRLNYVGFIDERNRDKNLNLLRKLLKTIVHTWPDVEFLTSVELGNMVAESN
ncbi:MAG: hypothetical protein R3281_16390 [Balneolaceae bacterium]|nr:hypothetical protein [Balneolaceae bacterium]